MREEPEAGLEEGRVYRVAKESPIARKRTAYAVYQREVNSLSPPRVYERGIKRAGEKKDGLICSSGGKWPYNQATVGVFVRGLVPPFIILVWPTICENIPSERKRIWWHESDEERGRKAPVTDLAGGRKGRRARGSSGCVSLNHVGSQDEREKKKNNKNVQEADPRKKTA